MKSRMSNYIKQRGEVISQNIRSTISKRYHTVTAAINREFWNSISATQNSLYVGSYGRGTAINSSDLDILILLT
jgi:UTP:GlnB (protein PII) uridylyltransferase